MFKTLVASLALSLLSVATVIAPATAAEVTGDHIPTRNGGDLVIHPLKHATMALAWNGATVFVDPALMPGGPKDADAAAAFAGMPSPDLILVGHMHPDHFDPVALGKLAGEKTVIVVPQSIMDQLPAEVKSHARVLANGQSTEVGKIKIEAVPAYNTTADRLKFHPKGRDNGYVLTVGGKRVYIAGDTEGVPEMRTLKNIDVAFIPMNLPYTMTPEAAAEAVLAFKPKIVYPYHYGQSDTAAFAKAVGSAVEVRQRNWY